jgi:hypothetical protein
VKLCMGFVGFWCGCCVGFAFYAGVAHVAEDYEDGENLRENASVTVLWGEASVTVVRHL